MAEKGLGSRRAAVTIVGAVGLILTFGLAWAARMAHDDNEDRLTAQRTLEASAVLTAAVPSIEASLTVSAAAVGAGAVDPTSLGRVLAGQVGPGERFVSASLWPIDDPRPLAVVGAAPALLAQPPDVARGLFERTGSTTQMRILDLLDESRLGYAVSVPGGSSKQVIYAEQELPADRMSVVQADSAFAGLDYALYLDTSQRSGSLLIASTSELPLEGRRAEEVTAFGDGQLRLVVSPTGDLGGDLLARLAGLVLATGLVVTAAAVVVTDRLQRRRREAEALAEENAAFYAEQRAASLTLQRNLLPRHLPEIPGLDVAVRYDPGVRGTEVGGDWYDVIEVGERAVLVVGDVSGRGLAAASVMAAIRHAVRTLALNGDPPEVILEKVNHPGGNDLVGHFVTVQCAVLDPRQGSLSVASAGHPPPLIVDHPSSSFASVPVGPPIGASAGARYEAVTVGLAPGATVVLFTDGVFERRHETLDVGLERLRLAGTQAAASPSELVDRLFERLSVGAGHDDAAILAVRWTT
jgi:serine phosphatase RsbU (regulator of sigma subunit)